MNEFDEEMLEFDNTFWVNKEWEEDLEIIIVKCLIVLFTIVILHELGHILGAFISGNKEVTIAMFKPAEGVGIANMFFIFIYTEQGSILNSLLLPFTLEFIYLKSSNRSLRWYLLAIYLHSFDIISTIATVGIIPLI